MRKNILQSEVKEELISRIEKLRPDAQKQWGKMNVNQMLRHNSMGIQQAYGDFTPKRKANWFTKKLMRFFILHSDMAPRKRRPTPLWK